MGLARALVLLLALSCGTGAALLVRQTGRPPKATQADNGMVEILVAARAIAAGEWIGKDQVRWQRWPRNALPAGGLQRQAEAPALPFEPGPARFPLLEGEPVSMAKLARAASGSPLAALLAPGMRAVSVPIRDETAAGGFIQPNDRVDVIITRKRTDNDTRLPRSEILLRGAKVLAIGKTQNGKASTPRTATLELAPADARALTAAQSAGEISLALIGTSDLARADLTTASIGEAAAADVRILKFGRTAGRQAQQQ